MGIFIKYYYHSYKCKRKAFLINTHSNETICPTCVSDIIGDANDNTIILIDKAGQCWIVDNNSSDTYDAYNNDRFVQIVNLPRMVICGYDGEHISQNLRLYSETNDSTIIDNNNNNEEFKFLCLSCRTCDLEGTCIQCNKNPSDWISHNI